MNVYVSIVVVPEAATDLRTHPSSPDVITVAWAFKSFKDFVPGLVHQVTVCIQNFTVPCNVTVSLAFITWLSLDKLVNIINILSILAEIKQLQGLRAFRAEHTP